MVKLVGFKRFTSKKGNELCIATVLRDATTREKEYGCVGQVAEDIFVPTGQIDYLTEKMIGKEIKLYWDRAFLEKIEVVG
ncbi:MAG: hypothetical protein IJF37_04460 [Lachnospiraceae bacterium]|nr:hypothetical protein [Lachnospiraceae bacterium]